MRLDDFDPNINVGSQSDRGGGFGGFGGGGGGGLLMGLLPLIASRFGCGGIIVLLIVMAVFGGGLGGLGSMVGMGGTPQVATRSASAEGGGAAAICSTDPARRATCNAFSSAENTWEALYAQAGQRFEAPSLQFFDGNGQSGCGAAQAAMGPFYCPLDRGIYIDTTFFNELATKFGAAGDFAQYYVVAHEFGHHIQTLTGASARVQQIQRSSSRAEGNAASVRLELQADCYAGVWAAQNRQRLEPGDVEEGMTAAAAIGDDRLQGQSGRNINQESFTHGSSEQRQRWLQRGLRSGDPAQCDTFSGAI
ncbi:MAG: zinc metalloprotease [Sphingomonas bacterium]|uniref:KPN_02809 family neutral zinc metallopeptidase n=1 Tax=Sphingomonas bacterium TaxID=1895847 RepID=UPI00262522A4|nr:neutral zinc metallopeptidase [Sphingomonas bacterium]MDB5696966.1 zinc metalloprotease [Sphingomonas bacterium]